jgi:hypothetical protein
VALAGLAVVGLSLVPWVINTLYPPAGTAFVGTFFYVDDFYNYLSYAQQAEGGSFLFENKTALTDDTPVLVNLEWWVVGALGRLMGGGHLALAYKIVGVLFVVAFLFVADRWLERLGLGEGHRLPALLLVATAGGLGGPRLAFAGRAPGECLDFLTGLFPFVGFLTNPHFTVGTTLLLLGLLLYDASDGKRALVAASVVATVLALVRPYDFVLLVLIRGSSVLFLDPPRRWLAGLLPLLALLPVTAYLYWLFYVHPAAAVFFLGAARFPDVVQFLWALGPAAVLALGGLLPLTIAEGARRARVQLVVWCVLAALVIVVQPVGFSLQFLVGIGFPLLALGALGLSRFPPAATLAAAALFALTFGTALHFMLTPRSYWLTGRQTMALVETLRTSCGRGELLLAPPDVGLFAHGLTPCRSFLSHPASPNHDTRRREVEGMAGMAPKDRRAFLDAKGVRFLALPGDPGPEAEGFLGPDAGWTRVGSYGVPPRLTLYGRRP